MTLVPCIGTSVWAGILNPEREHQEAGQTAGTARARTLAPPNVSGFLEDGTVGMAFCVPTVSVA